MVDIEHTTSETIHLPEGWAVAELPHVANIIMGQSPPGETYNTAGNRLPFFQGKAEFGEVHPTVRKWCSKPNKIAEAGDVLLSIRAPVGPTNVANQQCAIGRGLAAIRPLMSIPTELILLLMSRVNFALTGFINPRNV